MKDFWDSGLLLSPITGLFALLAAIVVVILASQPQTVGETHNPRAWPGAVAIAAYAFAGTAFMGFCAICGNFLIFSFGSPVINTGAGFIDLYGVFMLFTSYPVTIIFGVGAGLLAAKAVFRRWPNIRPQGTAAAVGILVGLLAPMLFAPVLIYLDRLYAP
jgi:hypothetical protein